MPQYIILNDERGKANAWTPMANGNIRRLTKKNVVLPRAAVCFQSLNDALFTHGVVERPNDDGQWRAANGDQMGTHAKSVRPRDQPG